MIRKGIQINSMTRTTATFRRYFQIRIQEEAEKDRMEKQEKEQNTLQERESEAETKERGED